MLTWQSFKNANTPYKQTEKLTQESSIGRAPDNSFVLHDPSKFVSRYHASVYEIGGNWFIRDTSSTGTIINETITLKKGQTFLLSKGDLISIGESVLLVDDITELQNLDVSLKPDFIAPPSLSRNATNERQDPIVGIFESVSKPNIQPETQAIIEPIVDNSIQINASPPESLNFNIEDFFDDEPDTPTTPEPQQRSQVVAPQSQQAMHYQPFESPYPNRSQDNDLVNDLSQDTIAMRAFLKELNMEPSQLLGQNKVEVLRVAGVLLKTLTEGMMGVLNARSLMKEKLGLDQTKIRQEKNNAFKFSGTPEDALAKMLTQESGYIDPVNAAKEAVNDAKAHQLAMISGLNAAIQQTIESFDPKSLEEEFSVGFALSKKAKYWDIYCQVYEKIAENAQSDSSNIFIKHFREHYEEQISKLNK
nr:type VI secretion system-associated FHA domain protein TagH [Rheinheimera maricola]